MTVIFAGNQVSLADQLQIVNLDLGDSVRIVKTFSVGTPAQIYQNVTIEHIDHRITPLAHEITFMFSPASYSTSTKTATGSGTGSQTATGLVIVDRTAIGTGSATTGDTAVGLHVAPRTATGSGAGTQTADARNATQNRTATGSGTGSETAVGAKLASRTATGDGTGGSSSTETITFVMILDDATRGILDTSTLGY